jgi:hypothetical protein
MDEWDNQMRIMRNELFSMCGLLAEAEDDLKAAMERADELVRYVSTAIFGTAGDNEKEEGNGAVHMGREEFVEFRLELGTVRQRLKKAVTTCQNCILAVEDDLDAISEQVSISCAHEPICEKVAAAQTPTAERVLWWAARACFATCLTDCIPRCRHVCPTCIMTPCTKTTARPRCTALRGSRPGPPPASIPFCALAQDCEKYRRLRKRQMARKPCALDPHPAPLRWETKTAHRGSPGVVCIERLINKILPGVWCTHRQEVLMAVIVTIALSTRNSVYLLTYSESADWIWWVLFQ